MDDLEAIRLEAIGLIETRGFVPMVVAVDAMSKAAHVSFVGCENVGGGLVTAVISGDIASVRHAAEVGSAAAASVGEVVAIRIIGRLVDNIGDVLPLGQNRRLRPGLPPEPGASSLVSVRAAPRAQVLSGKEVPQLPAGERRRPPRGRGQRGRKAPRLVVEVRAEYSDSERGRRTP